MGTKGGGGGGGDGGGLVFGPVGTSVIHDVQTRALLDVRAPLQEATRQVFAAQLQLVRSQISRAKMRAEIMALRAPIGAAGGGGGRGGGRCAPGVEETQAELKLSAARPRVRSFREALDQVRACEALGMAL
jgi:hypothetical protein